MFISRNDLRDDNARKLAAKRMNAFDFHPKHRQSLGKLFRRPIEIHVLLEPVERDLHSAQANANRPLGSGMGRPNPFAVSSHSLMTISTLLRAACRVGPSAAHPGNSGTSAMNDSSSWLQ